MSKKKLLDVTLRETPTGIYGNSNITTTINCLRKTGVDIIETSYLTGGDNYRPGSTVVNSIEQANQFSNGRDGNLIYSICMNGGSYDLSKIPEIERMGINAIRYVLMEGKFEEEIEDLRIIKRKGYKLFVQHRNIISYTESEIRHIIEVINNIGVDAYSMVDTNGSMYPDDLRKLVDIIMSDLKRNVWLGFHGHNNHMLATSNAEYFLSLTEDWGTVFVDGSVMGSGAGAGNANTELLALYLNKFYNSNYKIKYLYDLIDTVIPDIMQRCTWGYCGEYLVTGENNAMSRHGAYLRANLADNSLNNIDTYIRRMSKKDKHSDSISCWESYASDMKRDSKYKLMLLRIKQFKILLPLKKFYHSIRERKLGK